MGNLWMVNPLKKKRPDRVLALMGCMVGPRTDELEKRFPDVDLFMQPQKFEPSWNWLANARGWTGRAAWVRWLRPTPT